MILFDFDGVLVDSLNEILISAYNQATGERKFSLSKLPENYVELFRRNKHLLLGPARLGPLARWCLDHLRNGGDVDTILSREKFLKSLSGDSAELGDQFFAIRQMFINTYRKEWLEANVPYETIWNALKKFQDPFAILTYKNRVAVEMIFEHYGIKLDPSLIYSGEKGRTKTENIIEIDNRFDAEHYIFLDDALENLIALPPVLPGKITPMLASWGYASVEDMKEARAKGIEVVDEQTFVERYCRTSGDAMP